MNLISLFRKLSGLALSALLIGGITVGSNTSVQAQTRRVVIVRPYRYYRPYHPFGWDNSFYYGQYVFDNAEKAVNQGYHDGLKTGRDDGKKSKSFNPERSHYYHDAGFGNYAEVYRSGFTRGYRDGYTQAS